VKIKNKKVKSKKMERKYETAHQYLAFQVHNFDLIEVCIGCNIVRWLLGYLFSWFVVRFLVD